AARVLQALGGVSASLRHPTRRAGAAGAGRLPRAGADQLRLTVVSLVHAAIGRAPGELGLSGAQSFFQLRRSCPLDGPEAGASCKRQTKQAAWPSPPSGTLLAWDGDCPKMTLNHAQELRASAVCVQKTTSQVVDCTRIACPPAEGAPGVAARK